MSPQPALLDKISEVEKLIKRFQERQEKRKVPPPPPPDLRELLLRRRQPFLEPQLPVTRAPVSRELLRQRQFAPKRPPVVTPPLAQLLGRKTGLEIPENVLTTTAEDIRIGREQTAKSGLLGFLAERVERPLTEAQPTVFGRQQVKMLATLGRLPLGIIEREPAQELSTSGKILTLVGDVAAVIPWGSIFSQTGRQVVKQTALDAAQATYNRTFGKSLDAMIAKRGRGIPAGQFNRFQNLVYDSLVKNKPAIVESATNRMLARMGREPSSPNAIRKAVADTIADIDARFIPSIPKFTPGGSAVPGQTRSLVEIMAGQRAELVPKAVPITQAVWDKMTFTERAVIAEQAGLARNVANFEWSKLPETLQTRLTKPVISKAPVIPAPEVTAPKQKIAMRFVEDEGIADLSGNPIEVDSNGMVTLYHRTSKASADQMNKTGKFISKENQDETFFSNKPTGQTEGYGDTIVTIKVPAQDIRIDDAFQNEIHVVVSNNILGKANIIPQPAIPKAEVTPAPGVTIPDAISDMSGFMFSGSASGVAQSNWFSGSIDKALDFAKSRLKSGRGGEAVVRVYRIADIESRGANKIIDLMESSGKQIPSSEYSMMYLKDIKPTYELKLTKGFKTTKEDILNQLAIPKAEVTPAKPTLQEYVTKQDPTWREADRPSEILERYRASYERLYGKEPAPAVTAKPQAGKVPPAKTPPPAEPPVTAGQPPPAEGAFAGNIRLEKYPEEIRPFLKEWAEANPDAIAQARRGVRSDAEVLADAKILADDVGGDFARMQSRWKSGDAWNAEEILALRGTLRTKTEAVLAAQKAVSQTNSTENLLKLKLALEEQAAVQEAVSGVTAEAGRALRQFRQQVFEASTDAEKLERLLKEVGGRDKIEDLAKLLGEIDIDNPSAVNAFIRALNKPGFWDYITEIYYNSILSGPKTHIVNSLSNTFNTILSPVERGAAAIVDIPLSRWQGRPRGRFFREASADAFGAIEGIKDGFRAFGETYRTGISPQQASKFFEAQRTRAFTGLPGRVINFPSTSLEAADSLMQAINYRAAFNATALRIARRSGKKGAEAIEALAELKSNPTKELLKEAGRITEERLFRAPAGKTTQTIMNLRESLAVGGFKPLRYIVPFIRTPANLLKYGFERSPGGWLNPKLWKNVVAKNPQAADQIGRAVLGSLAAMAIALYVLEDKITGAAPTNSAERDRFYRDGKQPFSIKIGDNWIAYQRLEPFNQAFASVAATLGAIKDKERDVVGKATDVANTIAQNMVSQTYLSGLASVLDALAQPERYASRILTRFGTALIIPASSFTRTVAQMVDRTVRQPQNVVEEFKASVPGLSKQVPARLTAFGEEVTRKTPAWSPINISPSEETPLTRELDRLKINTGFTGKTIAGVPLTLDEQRAYQIQAGQKSKELLTALISNPSYNSLSDAEKEKAINARVDKARALVRTAILARIPPAERVSRIKKGVKTGSPVQAAPITPLSEPEEEKKPPRKKKLVLPR